MILASFINGDDVFMLYRSRGSRLAQETGRRLGKGDKFWTHYLESDGTLQVGVYGLEDDAHSTATQQANHAEMR